ncbi:MAG: hypothetical protein R3C15_00140 [Thermoleophilia bacterium]
MTRRPGKKVLASAAALAMLAGGGAAIAASQLGGSEDQQAIVADAAERLGVEPEQLSTALQEAYGARVDEAVASGQLTEEQGDALKQRVESGELPLVGVPLDRGGRFGHGAPGFGPGGDALEAAATYLGVEQADLVEQLRAGQSLADVAAAQGKTTDGLKQAIVDAAKASLAEAVADGKLTQGQADAATAQLERRADDLIAGTGPGAFGRGPGRGGPGGGHGHGRGHEHGHRGIGIGLDAAATYLGLTEQELAQQLRSGQSLADVAAAQGKTTDGLKQALTAAAEARLDEEVGEGDLTQEQADAMIEQLQSRLDDVIAGTGFGPRGRGHHDGGDVPEAPATPGPGSTSPNTDASL